METKYPFFDSYGTPIQPGDRILIETHYKHSMFDGASANVVWNAQWARLEWFCILVQGHGNKKFKYTEDFICTMKFKKIK